LFVCLPFASMFFTSFSSHAVSVSLLRLSCHRVCSLFCIF
jgi:hypothetical protein